MLPTVYVLHSIAFLDLLAVSIVLPLISVHVRQMGGSHLVLGALGSLYACFQLGSGPLIGSLSDIKGRKTVMIITLLWSSAAYLTIGLTNSIAVILLMRAVLGLFKQTQMLTRALVPDYEKDEYKQSEIYGKMAAVSGAGMTVGPIIGGHIVTDFPDHGFLIACVIVSLCFLLNTGLVMSLPNAKPVRRKNNIRSSQSILQNVKDSLKQSVVQLYKIQWSQYWDVFVLKALVGFAMGVYFSNYTLHLKTEYGLSQKYIGYIISFQGIVGSLSSYFIAHINDLYIRDKDYSLRNFHVFLMLSMSFAGLIMSSNVYMYTFWMIPFAIGNAVGRLVSLEMILQRSHGKHRGTLIGASNSVRSLSGVVSPMIAGFIGHYIGVPYVNFASLVATLMGLGIIYTSRKQKND